MKNWLPSLVPFIVSRSLILLILFMASQAHIFRHQAWEGEVISPHVELGSRDILPNLKSIATSGDARWYLSIAEEGYDFSDPAVGRMRTWVFFPLVPLLISLISKIVGSAVLAGLILSNLSFLLFLRVLFEICREERMTQSDTERLLWLICFFPVSYFFSMPLTESLFALLLSSSFLFLRKRDYFIASALLALTAITRPTGILVLPAFALALWLNSDFSLRRFILFFTPAGLVLAGLLAYFYTNTGDPLAFIHNQVFWDRSGSVLTLIEKFRRNPGTLLTGWNFIALNVSVLILGILTIFHFIKRKEWDYAAFLFFPLAIAINTGSVLSLARIAMPLFPLFIFLTRKTNRIWFEKTILLLFAATLGIMTLLYALHVTSAMA